MTSNIFETTVEYNDDFDEYYITIPEELTDRLGWEEGDVMEWIVNKDGTVVLQRSEEEYFNDDEQTEL
jgi:AbrB family looped-hinge helix DNA binding protein